MPQEARGPNVVLRTKPVVSARAVHTQLLSHLPNIGTLKGLRPVFTAPSLVLLSHRYHKSKTIAIARVANHTLQFFSGKELSREA